MATYQDFHRVIKETIQVDSDPNKRWTPQLVKFINHDNEFYGKFSGVVNATELIASNIGLSNVSLSGCKIYDLSGNLLSLDTIFPEIKSIRELVDRLSTDVLIDLQNEVYTEIPKKINNVKEYVDEVSSGISVLIDQKIEQSGKQSSMDLSAISTLLQSEIDSEIINRQDADDVLQTQITDISAKIKGGIVYRGIVYNADVDKLSDLVKTRELEENAEVRNGFMYIIKGHRKYIEGRLVDNGDYLYINTNGKGFESLKVKEITPEVVDILDAMDSHVYDLINAISSDVGGLKMISADHADRISTLETRQGEISGNLNSVIEHVDNLNASYELEGVNELSIITKVSQDKGQISIESKKLISSDVTGLKDFVENEISLSVKNIKSSIGEDGKFVVSVLQEDGKLINPCYSKITDSFIDENTISQSKVNSLTSDLFNISSELSTIERRRRGDVSLMGDFNWTQTQSTAVELSWFLKHATDFDYSTILRKGFLFRFPVNQSLKNGEEISNFIKNDYVLVREDVVLSDSTFGSFDYIKDYDGYIGDISSYIQSLNGSITLTSDSYISVLTKVEQKSGKMSFTAKELMSSDINGLSDWVDAKIKELDVTDKVIPEGGYIISSLKEVDGKIDYGTRKIVSSDIENLTNYVENEVRLSIESLDKDNSLESGKMISHLSQKNGIISVETTEILSNYVVGLSDYVQNEIKSSIAELDSEISSDGKVAVKISIVDGKLDNSTSEFSKITNSFIEDGAISQSKVSGLVQDLFNISSDLSSVIIRNRGDVSLMGDFWWYDATDLSLFLSHNTKKQWDYILRKGFLYRFSKNHTLTHGVISNDFTKNDYMLVRADVILSDATFESFNFIKDYDNDITDVNARIDNLNQEKISAEHGYIIDSIWEDAGLISASTRRLLSSDVENLEEYVSGRIISERDATHANYASLSGNNVISNYNEFTGMVKMDSLSVSFDKVYDEYIDKYLSVELPKLNTPKILDIAQRINDIITYSDLPIEKIENFNKTICNDLRVKTQQIYVEAYHEPSPVIEKFSEIVNILDGVLGVLKVKGTGLLLQTRLKLLKEDIELLRKYVNVVNTDLADLCVHVNLSCQSIGSGVSELSSNLNNLSGDYFGLKESTFHKFDEESHISSYGLIITDADHPEDTRPHDRYVMTFLSGTLVLEKI